MPEPALLLMGEVVEVVLVVGAVLGGVLDLLGPALVLASDRRMALMKMSRSSGRLANAGRHYVRT